MSETFEIPPGIVVITTHGVIQAQTHQCLSDARSHTEQSGAKNIRFTTIPGGLVDKARNDACRVMLQEGRQWVLFVDGDMVFAPDSIVRLLQTAYHTHPWADVVGGYCNLRGDTAIPTMDTGTGTWESFYPHSGIHEVIRTGGAFLLVKRHVCERIPQPWFALRVPMRPLDAFTELDNFARIKLDGANPFAEIPAWDRLLQVAREDPAANPHQFVPAEVGEDSGFCDRVKFAGMRIVVDTSVVTGHLNTVPVTGEDHKKSMQARAREQRYLVGLLN
jgi:hypothetical protein